MYFSSERNRNDKISGEYTISLNVLNTNYNDCCQLIEKNTIGSKIIRTETQGERTSIYFNVSINPNFDLQNLIEKLKLIDTNSKIEFVESGVNW